MKKKLYLHVGSHKTGTTSVQKYCYDNRHSLADKCDLHYPVTGTKPLSLDQYGPLSHSHVYLYAKMLRVKNWGSWQKYIAGKFVKCHDPKIWEKLRDEVHKRGCGKVLISYELSDFVPRGEEGFFGFDEEWKNNIAAWFPDHDIKIIYYIRRLDGFAKSSFTHLVRDLPYTTNASPNRSLIYKDLLLNERPGSVNDLAEFMEQLAKVFGKDNVLFRLYDIILSRDESVIGDIFSVMGVEPIIPYEGVRVNAKIANDSLQYLATLSTSIPFGDMSIKKDLSAMISKVFSRETTTDEEAVIRSKFESHIKRIDALVPGYAALFSERQCAIDFPDYRLNVENSLLYNLLFSMYARQSNRDFCALNNKIVGMNDGEDKAPMLCPVSWPEMERLALYKTKAGKLCFTPAELHPGRKMALFGTGVQNAELLFVENVLMRLGFADSGISAFDRHFLDYRGKTIDERLRHSEITRGELPYRLQARLVAEGQFLLGHVTSDAMAELPNDARSFLVLRDLRKVVIAFMHFQCLREGRSLVSAPASVRKFLLHGWGFDIYALAKECMFLVEKNCRVVRYEDLDAVGHETTNSSLHVLSDITERSLDDIRAAVTHARSLLPSIVMAADEEFAKCWDDEVERVFVDMGLHEVNLRLGYDNGFHVSIP